MKRRSLVLLVTLIVLLSVFMLHGHAAIGSPGGSWYMGDDGIMYMNPINGKLHFPSNWHQIEDDVIGLVIGEGTTYIDATSFDNMDNLEWVSLPEGLKSIGHSAFMRDPKLTSISIPDSVTSIDSSVFWECTSLKDVKLSSKLTTMGSSIFHGCTALQKVTIPYGIKSVGSNMFEECTALKTVSLPATLTSIGDFAFIGCSDLAGISIPDTVTEIGQNAFNGCIKLKQANLPASLKTLGYNAFYNSAITSVTVPGSVTFIGTGAFRSCTALTEVSLPESKTMNIEQDILLDSAYYNDSANWSNGVLYAGNIVICGDKATLNGPLQVPQSVVNMAQYAFDGCSGITSVVLSEKMSQVSTGAFRDCVSLTDLTLSTGITIIDSAAFSGCRSLSEIEIPANVDEIGDYAFYSCADTQTVTLHNPDTIIGYNAFGYIQDSTASTDPQADTTICGHWGSTAANYALEHGFLFLGLEGGTPTSGPCGNLTWEYDNGTLTISGAGPMTCANDEWPWQPFRGGISRIVIEEGVTTVGAEAFRSYVLVESLTMPSSINTIESHAFYDCQKLTGVTLPKNLVEIGAYAFYNCVGLTEISMPDTVSIVGQHAFERCLGLKQVSLSTALTEISDYAFSFTTKLTGIVIPDSVRIIGPHAFHDSTITQLTLGTGLTEIGDHAFESSDITELYVPGNVKTIGEYSFQYCYDLTKVVLSEGVESIEKWAFANISTLKEMQIPDSVNYIGNRAIPSSAYQGKEECLRDGLYYIGNALIKFDMSTIGSKVVIPEGTTCIAETALSYCQTMEELVIPEGITRIPWAAFDCNHRLTSVTLPRSVVQIDGENFTTYGDVFLPRVTFYGYALSYAQNYAWENGLKFIALDVAFQDLRDKAFYYEPVIWATENNITAGLSATRFGPDEYCTRGQVVTFLWRVAGCPAPTTTEHPFADVREGAYYYKAMLWAVENGITAGTTSTTFAPDDPCTRGQVVTFLWRAAGKPTPTATDHSFTDIRENGYYYKAMLWAVENNITAGITKTKFAPDDTCTRGQVVTFLFRYAG